MIFSSLITAFRTLTIIPVPGKDTERFHWALPYFPFIGIVLGSLQLLIFWPLTALSPNLLPLAGLILCGANYFLTGALHLDGFADSADAFGTVRNREKTLLILKDSHLGTYGVASVVFLILWRVVVYQSLAENNNLLWIIPCLALSRIIQGILLCIIPYARDNTGKAFIFSGKPRFASILAVEFIVVVIALYSYTGTFSSLLPVLTGLLCVIPLVFAYIHRIKGITGDGVGASSELFEIGFLTSTIVLFLK